MIFSSGPAVCFIGAARDDLEPTELLGAPAVPGAESQTF